MNCDEMDRREPQAGTRQVYDLLAVSAILFHMPDVVEATWESEAIIAITSSARIRPYSTAVAPRLSREIARMIFPMLRSRSSVPWSGTLG